MLDQMAHRTRIRSGPVRLISTFCAVLSVVSGQRPEASVHGSVVDSGRRPVAGATIVATQIDSGVSQESTTDTQGKYAFVSLPPGIYKFRAEKSGFHAPEKQGVELAVNAKLELGEFTLQSETANGTDPLTATVGELQTPSLAAETVASSVSVVVDESKILQLPLANRNIYSLFLLQPGVTSQGATVTRGLTFSVHGQRVSASNYLLDGVDNNNIVLTGPATTTSAETVQEFRMINSNFSAEYGRATSFVAQVVTRPGSNTFHGSIFEFFSHEKLNANSFQNNADGIGKSPTRHNQLGYAFGGPIVRGGTFFSQTLELSRRRYVVPEAVRVPLPSFIAGLRRDSTARRLLDENPPVPSAPCSDNPNVGCVNSKVSSRIDTLLTTIRLDHILPNAKDRVIGRYTLSKTDERPGNPAYPGLTPTDQYGSHNSLLGWIHSFDASRVSDMRLGWSRSRITLPRPRPDLPILQGMDFIGPASDRRLDSRDNTNVVQLSESFSSRKGRTSIMVGFEYRRNLRNGITEGLQSVALGGTGVFAPGLYGFRTIEYFGNDQPEAFLIDVRRSTSAPWQLPNRNRRYRSNEYGAFIEADMKIARRVSLNLGLRYEYFGPPHNDGPSSDMNFYFGAGSTIEERFANGGLRSMDRNSGDLRGLLYRSDRLNFAPSIGLAWDPFGGARTVIRAGYAIALDRVFDTAKDLRTNDLQIAYCQPDPDPTLNCKVSFLLPAEQMLSRLPQTPSPAPVIQLDENFRTPYAQNWYFGVERSIKREFFVTVGHVGSVGRELISRDQVNRALSYFDPRGHLNPAYSETTFLSNMGNSNYLGLELEVRRRFSRGVQFQASYTFSHAIDNQSDIFEGVGVSPGQFALAAFTREFDPRVDRGNANFDQRHNLIFNSIWELPNSASDARWQRGLRNGWSASVIGGYRSGFPVTVVGAPGTSESGYLFNNRADFVPAPGTSGILQEQSPIQGGVQWLDRTAFRFAPDHVGSLGRGAIRGPAFWNYDFALSRTIAVADALRLQIRMEFYNLFNHANLSPPVTQLSAPDDLFGKAFFGRNRTFSRVGELPLEDPARKIQLGLRIRF